MPDRVETRLGTLQFTDGFPDDATVEKVFDNLDFQHAVQAFLTSMPAASLAAIRKAARDFGPDNQTVTIFESLMDSRSLYLTANTESIYAMGWLDLKKGPVVVESPPDTLGLVMNFGSACWRAPRSRPGRQAASLSAGFRGHATRRLLHVQVPNLRQLVRDTWLSSERRSEAGRGRHQAAAAESIRWRTPRSRRRRTSSTCPARPSTRSMRWMLRSSRK